MFPTLQQSLFSSASSAWAIHVGSTCRLARQKDATIRTFVTEAEQKTPVRRVSWHEALVRGGKQQRSVTSLAS